MVRTDPDDSNTRRVALAFERVAAVLAVISFFWPLPASADEGGVGAWVPGFFGSMAATPQPAGAQVVSLYYHASVEAGGNAEFPIGGGLSVGIDGNANLGMLIPGYVFPEPVLGGQLYAAVALSGGNMKASADVTLTGPNGGVLRGKRTEEVTALGDIVPTAILRWNEGVHNFMVFAAAGLPTGSYDEDRLANIGIGHGSLTGGVGYTYFNPQTGYEFSAVPGLTYNFENNHTDYQNGVDFHLDVGASKFLEGGWQIGLVGYAYQQISGDSGEGAVLGDFQSRVFGVGPQLGFSFPVGGAQGYLNAKAYYEFGAENRPEGWNAWVTFAITPSQHQTVD